MLDYEIEVPFAGEVSPKKGTNTRTPYEHQKQAMACLDVMNSCPSYSTMVVLPTGGGKTYTASLWLLKNALDQEKKILWIAHRQMLLDQAANSFKQYAYHEVIPHIGSFHYRIVSGASSHDRAVHIQPTDDLLIASKDSLGRNLQYLDEWLKGEQEIFLVVDEAHHSTAKTYRKVIDHVRGKVGNVKLIGLTATPFRTGEGNTDQGLGNLYTDGVENGAVVRGRGGIAYKIDLGELIGRQILARPIFEEYNTDESYGESIGLAAWERIQHLDALPEDIAQKLAGSAARNKMIVDTWFANRERYGQTIVFALNRIHAVQLAKQFNRNGKRIADYILSDMKDLGTGASRSEEDNQARIESFRAGDLQVLINVNILTEGIDLPMTKTVFLTRPTVSTILMTQMVGRALRGSAAGGTENAYIVSFIDKWDEHIAWVNPESLFVGGEPTATPEERRQRELRLISVAKIEEFAEMLDRSIDTSELESVPFLQRVPVGMYMFSYLEPETNTDLSCQVMVYDSAAEAWQTMMKALPSLFEGVEDEFLSEETLARLEQRCQSFFPSGMIPPYSQKDMKHVLKYYAQFETEPPYYTFEDIDRGRLDVSKIAKIIYDMDFGPRKKMEYINDRWNDTDDNILRLFFGRKQYFVNQIDIELYKLSDPEYDPFGEKNVDSERRKLKELPLREIGKINPAVAQMLRDGAFAKAWTNKGYRCVRCGVTNKSRKFFEVDHIVPMNKGGESVPENLQVLCAWCNAKKGDRK